jgi:hypothetical protein
MRFRSFSAILDECLAAVRNGESPQACLERYPKHADRLRPLLTLVGQVGRTPQAAARPWAQATAWDLVRHRAAELRTGRRRAPITISHAGWLRPVAVALALVIALMAGGGATALAAQDALPDSPLYRVKLFTEDARLWFVFDDTHKAEILLDQSGTRVEEIMAMVQKDDPIPSNVLSTLRDRDVRAAIILADKPEETALRARVLAQAEAQERLLIDLWPQIDASARGEYTEVVAVIHNTRLQGAQSVDAIQPEELSGGVLNISGVAQPVSEGVWNVGGVEVRIDNRTIGHEGLQPGGTARLIVAVSSNGRKHALTLSNVQVNAPPNNSVVYGAVEKITDQGITVAGQLIPFDSSTIRKVDLREGERVQVTLGNSGNGVFATSVATQSSPLTLEGPLEGDIQGISHWTVAGQDFKITPETHLEAGVGGIRVGARVEVEAVSDGKDLLAQRLTVLASDQPATALHITGSFAGTDKDDGLWTVSGVKVVPPENAADPALNSVLAIEATRQNGDILVNRSSVIMAPDQTGVVRFYDTITSVNGSLWTLQSFRVRVASTVPKSGGRSGVGVRVLGWGKQGSDGTLTGVYVRILDDHPVITTPTPAPDSSQ